MELSTSIDSTVRFFETFQKSFDLFALRTIRTSSDLKSKHTQYQMQFTQTRSLVLRTGKSSNFSSVESATLKDLVYFLILMSSLLGLLIVFLTINQVNFVFAESGCLRTRHLYTSSRNVTLVGILQFFDSKLTLCNL